MCLYSSLSCLRVQLLAGLSVNLNPNSAGLDFGSEAISAHGCVGLRLCVFVCRMRSERDSLSVVLLVLFPDMFDQKKLFHPLPSFDVTQEMVFSFLPQPICRDRFSFVLYY